MKKVALFFSLAFAGLAQMQTPQVQCMDDTTSFAEGDVVMGSTQNILALYLCVNSTAQDIQITNLVTLNSTTANKESFTNLSLYIGGSMVAVPGAAMPAVNPAGYQSKFSPASPTIIPHNNSVSLTLRGDVAPYASGGATDNSINQFQISSVTAIGVQSQQPVTVGLFAYGAPVRVLRSQLFLGVTTSDSLKLSANPAGVIVLNKLNITFSDKKTTPVFLSSDNILLLDENNNDIVASGEAFTVVGQNTITWYFISGLLIPAGGIRSLNLSLPFPIRASVEKSSDVVFTDGLDSAATPGLFLTGLTSTLVLSNGN